MPSLKCVYGQQKGCEGEEYKNVVKDLELVGKLRELMSRGETAEENLERYHTSNNTFDNNKSINTPYQPTLSTRPLHTAYQPTLTTYPITTTQPINALHVHISFTHPLPTYSPTPSIIASFSLQQSKGEIEEDRQHLEALHAKLEEAGMTGGGMGSTQERFELSQRNVLQSQGGRHGGGRQEETRGRQVAKKAHMNGGMGGVKTASVKARGAHGGSTSARANSRDGGNRGNIR